MPTTRDAFDGTVVNGKFYAIGGSLYGQYSYMTTNEVYNPSTNAWSTLRAMPTGRHSVVVGAINGVIYVVGGYNYFINPSAPQKLLEAYNIASDTWATLAPNPENTNGHGAPGFLATNGSFSSEPHWPSPGIA